MNDNTVSTQGTCYSVDSYTYLYSTGFGTLHSAHSSGIENGDLVRSTQSSIAGSAATFFFTEGRK